MIRAVLGLAALALAAVAAAEPSSGIAVTGQVEHALTLSLADLKALPAHAVDVTYETGHGGEHQHHDGALVWDVIAKAGIAEPADKPGKHHLQHALKVIGRDGYTVALAIAEIDPEFEGKAATLTTDEADGQVRLIVPGDKRGGRAVRDVVKVEVE